MTECEWCPAKEDVNKLVDRLYEQMEYVIRFADNGGFFKGKIRGLECAVEEIRRYTDGE